MIERKIGEVFEVDGKLLKCVITDQINACSSLKGNPCHFSGKTCEDTSHLNCLMFCRKDMTDVCFVEAFLEPDEEADREVKE